MIWRAVKTNRLAYYRLLICQLDAFSGLDLFVICVPCHSVGRKRRYWIEALVLHFWVKTVKKFLLPFIVYFRFCSCKFHFLYNFNSFTALKKICKCKSLAYTRNQFLGHFESCVLPINKWKVKMQNQDRKQPHEMKKKARIIGGKLVELKRKCADETEKVFCIVNASASRMFSDIETNTHFSTG